MKKKELKSNNILDTLSIRINDTLKSSRISEDKRNNAFYWIFRVLILLLYIKLIDIIFDAIAFAGSAIIVDLSMSLRGLLSSSWVFIINFMKFTICLYLLYSNLKVFTESAYYKNLYLEDNEMKKKKKKFFNIITIVLKALAVALLAMVGLIATIILLLLAMLISMLFNGIYFISPIIILFASFLICYFTFKLIQNKFFDSKQEVRKYHYVITLFVLLIGMGAFIYETSGYEKSNKLPEVMNMTKEEKTFDVSDKKTITIQTSSKFDNITIYNDETLVNEIRVELEYFETTKANYTYYFANDDELYLKFGGDMDFKFENISDVVTFIEESLRTQTIYNYNLFKYPNINIYASSNNADKINIKTSNKLLNY